MPDPTAPHPRIATYNIHGAVGGDGRFDPERTAHVIHLMQPDILTLQEVDSRARPKRHHDMFDFLRHRVGLHAVEVPAISEESGHYGQMLFSRWPFLDVTTHDISVDRRERRKLVDTHVALPHGRLRVIATHLGLLRSERRRQARLLRRLLERDQHLPTVLLGDLNEWRRSGPVNQMLREFLFTVALPATFPARLPLLPLDAIWHRPHSLVRRLWTMRAAPAPRASDHLPLMGELRLA